MVIVCGHHCRTRVVWLVQVCLMRSLCCISCSVTVCSRELGSVARASRTEWSTPSSNNGTIVFLSLFVYPCGYISSQTSVRLKNEYTGTACQSDIIYRVAEIKQRHFTFLLVTNQYIHKFLYDFFAHINYRYIKQQLSNFMSTLVIQRALQCWVLFLHCSSFTYSYFFKFWNFKILW